MHWIRFVGTCFGASESHWLEAKAGIQALHLSEPKPGRACNWPPRVAFRLPSAPPFAVQQGRPARTTDAFASRLGSSHWDAAAESTEERTLKMPGQSLSWSLAALLLSNDAERIGPDPPHSSGKHELRVIDGSATCSTLNLGTAIVHCSGTHNLSAARPGAAHGPIRTLPARLGRHSRLPNVPL